MSSNALQWPQSLEVSRISPRVPSLPAFSAECAPRSNDGDDQGASPKFIDFTRTDAQVQYLVQGSSAIESPQGQLPEIPQNSLSNAQIMEHQEHNSKELEASCPRRFSNSDESRIEIENFAADEGGSVYSGEMVG